MVLVKLVAVIGLCCWYFTFCCCFAFCLCELFGGLFWILIWLIRLFVVGGRHDCWIWCWELVGLVWVVCLMLVVFDFGFVLIWIC